MTDDTQKTQSFFKQFKNFRTPCDVIWLLQFLCGTGEIFIAVVTQCLEYSKHSKID